RGLARSPTTRRGEMKCHEIMTRDPQACTADETCLNAAQMLCDANIGSLPVVDDPATRRVSGMVTDRDICCRVVAEGRDATEVLVGDVMSDNIVTCREDDDVETAERLMEEHQIRRIPVTDDDGRLSGIIAQADIARFRRPRTADVVEAVSAPKRRAA